MAKQFPTGLRFTINGIECIVIEEGKECDFYSCVECPTVDHMYMLRENDLKQIAVIPAQPVIDLDYASKADFYWSRRNKSLKFLKDLKKHLKIK